MNGFRVRCIHFLKAISHLLLSGCFAVDAVFFFWDGGYSFSSACLLLTIILFAFGVDEIREYYGE
jgi:hypothetical protein